MLIRLTTLGPLLLLMTIPAVVRAATQLSRVADSSGDVVAVTVPAGVALLHTPQLHGADATAAMDAVDRAVAGGELVKLNIVARTSPAADDARAAVRKRYPAAARPAVSVVVGELPDAAATVGVDAVAIPSSDPRPTSGAILPAGPRVYVAGQAEKGATPAEAAAKTIARLKSTLSFVGSTPADVVQAKCFLTPMSAAASVAAEFEKALGKGKVPLVFVEWKSDLPIEIELIASCPLPAPDAAPAVEYLTPPGMAASPVFARVTRVTRCDLTYIATLTSAKPGTGEEQVASIFEQLKNILTQTDSDLQHLVKATYYVSDADASTALNVIRPTHYDPKRPPSASKAMVPSVGTTGRSVSLDMIAVPTTQPKP